MRLRNLEVLILRNSENGRTAFWMKSVCTLYVDLGGPNFYNTGQEWLTTTTESSLPLCFESSKGQSFKPKGQNCLHVYRLMLIEFKFMQHIQGQKVWMWHLVTPFSNVHRFTVS